MFNTVVNVVQLSARAALLSIRRIPELFAQSQLGSNQYDIRGAMRGPGGEDHVGCLTLMRLAFESDRLVGILVSEKDLIPQVCEVCKELKSIEMQRGPGVIHGVGSAPKSRRILLSVLCHAELISDGSAGASDLLTDLFNAAVSTIASFKAHAFLFHAETLFQICEATLDISSFSSSVVCSLFAIYHDDSSSIQRKECLEVLTEACIQGYKRHSASEQPDQASVQVSFGLYTPCGMFRSLFNVSI